MINNIGAQVIQVSAVLLLKLIFYLLTKLTEPKFVKEKNKKVGELEKVEKMMKEELDIKKSEAENQEK